MLQFRAIKYGIFIGIGLLAVTGAARAVEGMWMPSQVPELAGDLKRLGFQGDPEAFADLTGQPMGAIVSLGFRTASLVSPDGLIVTNHHCVDGFLQYNSAPGKNLVQDGFLAKSRKEELPAGPGTRIWVAESIEDVTGEVLEGLDAGVPDREYYGRIEDQIKAETASCETGGYRCRVSSFFGGSRYFRIRYQEIRDVRLVYAPAEGIGVFGGETDNFRWPRHTGDWGYLRAYVASDGKPADYAAENVPYKPKHWLQVSPKGASPGDLVMVVGYPGRTQRHRTYEEVRETVEEGIPRRTRISEERVAILKRLAEEGEDLAIKVGGRIRGMENGLTYRRGILAGMIKGGVLELRRKQEAELTAWIEADPDRTAKYGDVLPRIRSILEDRQKTRDRDNALRGLYAGSTLLNSADTFYRIARERLKPDAEREIGYQDRDFERTRQRQQRAQRSLDIRVDRALFRHAILEAARLKPGERIVALDHAVGIKAGMAEQSRTAAVDKFLDRYYADTRMAVLDARLAMMEKSTAQLEKLDDPAMKLAIGLFSLIHETEESGKTRSGALAKLRPRYMSALLEKAGGRLYPDANGTLRITYGTVKGAPAADGVYYTPQTTLAGLAAKNKGEGDFNAPGNLMTAIEALRNGKATRFLDEKLGDVPVNFLSDLDTTGGNSGSPTLNAEGELCGLLFDGTFEAMAADYLFDGRTTRSIHVDSRFMLWVMQEVDHADNLLKELGITE